MFSIIIPKLFTQKDIRNYGSKSAGSTNVLNVIGWKVAIFVYPLDFFKGSFSFWIAIFLRQNVEFFSNVYLGVAIIGVVVGHIFPIFFNFRGGKSVAVFFGAFYVLNYWFILILPVLWISLNYITKYVAIGSCLSCLITFGLSFYTISPLFSMNAK